jgi:hypothetical protein
MFWFKYIISAFLYTTLTAVTHLAEKEFLLEQTLYIEKRHIAYTEQ